MQKMIMAIIPHEQAEAVLEALVDAGHTATFTPSRGGVLRMAQEMLFIVAENHHLEKIVQIIRQHCHTQIAIETRQSADNRLPKTTAVDLGGAIIFVWTIDRVETF